MTRFPFPRLCLARQPRCHVGRGESGTPITGVARGAPALGRQRRSRREKCRGGRRSHRPSAQGPLLGQDQGAGDADALLVQHGNRVSYGACTHVRRLIGRSCGASNVSAPGGPGDRKPRAEAASDGAEERTPPPTARRRRPSILGCSATLVVWVDESPAHRQPGYRGPMAPGRFRRTWATISQRRQPGRPRVDAEIRRLIRRMAQDGWKAPRIHAALTKGAFPISRSRAHTHWRHGHPLQTVPSAGLIERAQEKNRFDALR